MLIVSHLTFDRLDRAFIVHVNQLVPNDSTDRHIQALFFDLRAFQGLSTAYTNQS